MRLKLRNWRTENRLTQEALASQIGVTREYISFIENGKSTPSRDVAAKIELVTGIPRLEILYPDEYIISPKWSQSEPIKIEVGND